MAHWIQRTTWTPLIAFTHSIHTFIHHESNDNDSEDHDENNLQQQKPLQKTHYNKIHVSS